MGEPWSQSDVQELTRMWEAGCSATEIAKSLAYSRGAIMGKIHRLRLPCRDGKPRAPIPTRAAYLKRYRELLTDFRL